MNDHLIKRIEGHGNLQINFQNQSAQVLVEEEERLFEQLVVNYPYYRAPFITARICGICPTAHYLASIKAIENAFGIKPSQTITKIREALLAAQIAQSHTLHLFFLVLPDYLKVNSVKEMAQKYPAEFHLGLNLKNTADKLVSSLGGREVHPLTPKVGGHTHLPSLGKINTLLAEIDDVLDEAGDTIRLVSKINYPILHQENRAYLSVQNKENRYPLYSGQEVTGTQKEKFDTKDYQKHIKESERKDTLVKFSRYSNKKQKLIMVGALARLNKASDLLMPQAKKLLIKSGLSLPSNNPFDNILAQAIEISHYLEVAKEILSSLDQKKLDQIKKIDIKTKAGEGVGAVEAPRGVLYHYYKTNKEGTIIKADIITPTASAMLSLEDDADNLVKTNQDQSRAKIELMTEELIRAYDPCLTCSVH